MDSTPDREEKMTTAAPETTLPPAYQVDEDGEDLVLRIPKSMVTREQVQRFLDRLKFEYARSESEPEDLEEFFRHRVGLPLSTRERALRAIEHLPEDAGIDEVMNRLYFLSAIERGLKQIETGQVVSHEEAKRRFGL